MKNIHLPQAELKTELSGESGTYKTRITSPVLARSVYLSFGNLDVNDSDQSFDLLPGETVELTVKSAASIGELKPQMKLISLFDAFAS